MKKISMFFCLLIVMMACDKSDNEPELKSDEFKVVAKLNGDAWEAPASITILPSGNSEVMLFGLRDQDHWLNLKFKLTGEGNLPLEAEESKYMVMVGGDVVSEEYKLNGPAVIRITRFSQTDKIVEGTFDGLKFKEKTSGEIIELKNGKFRSKISNGF